MTKARRPFRFPRAHARALIGYYRDCVAAESRTEAIFRVRDGSIALITDGPEPAVAHPTGCEVPVRGPADAWASRQLSSAGSPAIACGYPLTVARRGGHLVVAPMFTRECHLEWQGTGIVVGSVGAPLETNEHALALLGWDPEARALWLEEMSASCLPSFAEAIRRTARAGIRLMGVDPRRLSTLPRVGLDPVVANTAMLFVAEPANSALGVLSELDQLFGTLPPHICHGPLGIFLGTALPAAPRRGGRLLGHDHAAPVVLPSNAAQDRSIRQSLGSPLTVVTGPPGTGKSQVLVNAIAATVIAGQSVLIASRTNRAVDVVFERLRELSDGAPIRAGRAVLRTQAADQIRDTVAGLSRNIERERAEHSDAGRLAIGRDLWHAAWAERGGHAPRRAREGAAAVARQLEAGRPRPNASDYHLGLGAFPVWGLTNLTAAACLPLTARLFDLVVIDEAAQCDVASALPLIARARRALIIGDPHQLGHVSRLSAERERVIAFHHCLSAEELAVMSQRQRSLYDVAAFRLGQPPLLLDEHYRCHPRIIGFSNERIYGGRLTVRAPATPGGGLAWRDVAGSFHRGPDGRSAVNPEEALAVVKQLEAEQAAHPTATIGVVTPFRAQAELVRRLASEHRREGSTQSGSVTIDTVHRFQGDERDIMLMSPTVSGAMPGFFRRVAGQPRLLNVAVTRARYRLVVVGDRGACIATGGMLADLATYATPLTGEPNHAWPGGDRRHRQERSPRS